MHLLLAIATFVGAASVCFNHVMTKVQRITFCQKLKIWYLWSHRWSKNHICRQCQWCTTPPSTSRLTRSWSVCLASWPKVIIVVVYCLKYVHSCWNTFVTISTPKAPWDQSDRVTLLRTRRPPLTRHMALHQWVATFFISDIMTALNWICWSAWRVIIELTFCWGCWMFPVIPLNSNSNNFSNYVMVNETSTKCTFNSHIFQSC